MGISLLDLLLPREAKFFNYLNDQAEHLYKTAIAFRNLVVQVKDMDTDEIRRQVITIMEMEHKGDRIERFIVAELDNTFITPLDREDIHALVVKLDHTLNLLNNCSQKIEMYHLKQLPKPIIQFTNIIVDACYELKKIMACLRERKNLPSIIRRIHFLESSGDHLFHVAMAELFESKNSLEIIKLKEVYEPLEQVLNSAEDIAKLVRGIAVKQG